MIVLPESATVIPNRPLGIPFGWTRRCTSIQFVPERSEDVRSSGGKADRIRLARSHDQRLAVRRDSETKRVIRGDVARFDQLAGFERELGVCDTAEADDDPGRSASCT